MPMATPRAGSLGAAGNAVEGERLARDAGERVELVGVEGGVGADDPGHLALARAVVGGGDVDGGADHVLAVELGDVSTSGALQEALTLDAGVDAQSTLGPAEGGLDEGALVRHQAGEGADLVRGNVRAEADTALGGQAVEAVLGAEGLDHADGAVVVAHGEAHVVDDVAHLDLVEDAAGVVAVGGGALELRVDIGEKVTGVSFGRHGSPVSGKAATVV